MRRMYSEKQIAEIVKQNPEAVVKALEGQDISVEGITSKGIANTGNIATTGDIASSGNITGKSIIQNMTGFSMASQSVSGLTKQDIYAGIVQNGNKLTIVYAFTLTRTETLSGTKNLINITIPSEVGEKLFVVHGSLMLDAKSVYCFDKSTSSNSKSIQFITQKQSNTLINLAVYANDVNLLNTNDEYYIRIEQTFLLSENLVSE